jgi:hypothetical protein
MQVYVTENKSVGHLQPAFVTVRVFVDRDFGYGYWINERQLLDILGITDPDEYLTEGQYIADVDVHTAQRIINCGVSPYSKRVLPGASAPAQH